MERMELLLAALSSGRQVFSLDPIPSQHAPFQASLRHCSLSK
jgi:hypothetical protein